jgi:hypothetical protein
LMNMLYPLVQKDDNDVNLQMQAFGRRRGRTCIAAV